MNIETIFAVVVIWVVIAWVVIACARVGKAHRDRLDYLAEMHAAEDELRTQIRRSLARRDPMFAFDSTEHPHVHPSRVWAIHAEVIADFNAMTHTDPVAIAERILKDAS